MVLQTEITRKKKFLLEIYRRIYSIGECVKYRHIISVGKIVDDCEICTKTLWNADRLTLKLKFPRSLSNADG
jgi:hypothetical protein